MKGLKKEENLSAKTSVAMTRGRGGWGVEEGEGGRMVREGDWTWGGEHTVQHADDVLLNWTPETCMMLLTKVTPVN